MPVEFVPALPATANQGTQRNGRAARMTDEAQTLKTRPQTWAIIARRDTKEKASALASNIRRGKSASFNDGRYETATSEQDGMHVIYARYVGPAEAPASF
jgi:hypothetical protein